LAAEISIVSTTARIGLWILRDRSDGTSFVRLEVLDVVILSEIERFDIAIYVCVCVCCLVNGERFVIFTNVTVQLPVRGSGSRRGF